MSDEENLHGQIINVLTEYKLPTPPFHFKIKILISLGLDTVTKSTVVGRPDCSVSLVINLFRSNQFLQMLENLQIQR